MPLSMWLNVSRCGSCRSSNHPWASVCRRCRIRKTVVAVLECDGDRRQHYIGHFAGRHRYPYSGRFRIKAYQSWRVRAMTGDTKQSERNEILKVWKAAANSMAGRDPVVFRTADRCGEEHLRLVSRSATALRNKGDNPHLLVAATPIPLAPIHHLRRP